MVDTDPNGAQLRRDWLEAQGLWFDDDNYSYEDTARGATITKAFVKLCVKTVQSLHASGLIEELFSRPVPVIIHELEYYDEIAVQNIEANGSALASDIAAWIR